MADLDAELAALEAEVEKENKAGINQKEVKKTNPTNKQQNYGNNIPQSQPKNAYVNNNYNGYGNEEAGLENFLNSNDTNNTKQNNNNYNNYNYNYNNNNIYSYNNSSNNNSSNNNSHKNDDKSESKRSYKYDNGEIDRNGYFKDKYNWVVGQFDNGVIRDKDGWRIREYDNDGNFKDNRGCNAGKINSYGVVTDKDGNKLGEIDDNGKVRDANGSIIGDAGDMPKEQAAYLYFLK